MDKRTTKNGLKNEWDLTGKLNRVTTQRGNFVFITDYEYYRLVPGSDIYGKIIKYPYIKLITPENLKSEMKKHDISVSYLSHKTNISSWDLMKLMYLKNVDVSLDAMSVIYNLIQEIADTQVSHIKVLSHQALKDLMFEFDVRDSDLVEHSGVDREIIRKIKKGDTSVGYTLYESVSKHMYDLYMMTNPKDYYVR
ncbi:MAG: hypothetical protein CBD62_01210 [Candidatus Pelagibacter sp. TMED202]|nr:MAG: hypothetical protein CBD62_01210 [Candidatus Pelagibacter sp. TMED202]|tara:strand:- start:462 stop:1046 length:585 start_codon:yes stop_codon:yes gene_type:complete